MSFHAGQTFTFGETPSATKWNYLWENDYALADGTGISDNAIDSRHYVDGSIDPEHLNSTVGNFEVLYDSGEIGSPADSISSGTITAKKFLRVYMNLLQSGNITSNLRFNNDSGTNYAFNRDSGDSTSATSIGTGNSSLDQYSMVEIHNKSANPKPVIMFTMFGSASAAAAPTKDKTNGKWHNTSAQITRIDAINGGSGDFAAGSRLLVLGRN